ncbi:hypothetical protein M0802_015793 [Mischocyttarus mexicanus]|nr:hypothetical protein M0802_015793 [Mischocyttarus mexicanus]
MNPLRHVIEDKKTADNRMFQKLTKRMQHVTVWDGTTIYRGFLHHLFQIDTDQFEVATSKEVLLEEEPIFLQDFAIAAAGDSYDVSSFEDDGRLKTVESEGEDDDEHHHENIGMSSSSSDKLQILWDHFIHAEPLSYEVCIKIYSHSFMLHSVRIPVFT